MIPELLLVVRRHFLHELKQFVVTACRALALLARHVDSHHRGQAFDGFHEVHVVVLHEETQRGAMFAAAETVIKPFRRADRKRRGFFVVKRAAGLELAARFLELYAAADHLDDIRPGDQIVDEVLWYQAAHNLYNA